MKNIKTISLGDKINLTLIPEKNLKQILLAFIYKGF